MPKKTEKYYWTRHAAFKMKFYGLSEQRIRAVIRNPMRKEEGIVKNTIAVMQPPSTKKISGKPRWSQEIWAMYQKDTKRKEGDKLKNIMGGGPIKIISAWRYPGVSPQKDPIPQEILDELKNTL